MHKKIYYRNDHISMTIEKSHYKQTSSKSSQDAVVGLGQSLNQSI